MAVNQGSPGPPQQQQELIRVTPGGLVSAIPAHTIGFRGSTPYIDQTYTIDGFLNFISLNGQVATAFSNGFSTVFDAEILNGTLLIGGLSGTVDSVDVAIQRNTALMFSQQTDTAELLGPVFNSECIFQETAALVYGAYQEGFTKSGTGVTVTDASNSFVGIGGTTWTTDQLAGAYMPAANIALNGIIPGDLIGVNNAGGTVKTWFRILSVVDNTHLNVFPTPTTGNIAIGVNRDYKIIRTGYGGYSRSVVMTFGTQSYWYYAGSSYNGKGSGQDGHGVVQALAIGKALDNHYMAPKTVDNAGTATAFFPRADDVIYYKGFLLYGADTAVSWSVGAFPTAGPFAQTNFPAANITVVDATSRFVTFEQLGDQVIALFEDSMYLISATGTVPEFTFYRLPETLTIQQQANTEQCGIANAFNRGRPSCSGRGAIYYQSDRGIEEFSGGLSKEISAPIQNIIGQSLFVSGFFQSVLSWSDDFNLLWVRPAYTQGFAHGYALVYCPATDDWSVLRLMPPKGLSCVAITGGTQSRGRESEIQRKFHVSYYDILTPGGVVPTNGGTARTVVTGPDNISTHGAGAWKWRTPVIALGLHYPAFSFGGFIIDAYTTDSVTMTWTLYGGTSPYTMFLRDTNSLTMSSTYPAPPAFGSSWLGSRKRLGKKIDDPFIFIELSGSNWIQLGGVVIFNADTKAVR